jgi:cell division protein FtsI/penicillin-binding protein 2
MIHDITRIKNRTFLVLGFFLILYCTIIGSLYILQIQKSQFFHTLGQKQYNVSITTKPARAQIYDVKGNIIACNKTMYSAFVLPREISDPERTKTFLKKHFPESVSRLEQNEKQYFIFIKRNISHAELELIQKENVSDIHILHEPHRYYPYPSLGPIIGCTDIDNNGLFGLEQKYNEQLSGTPSIQKLQQDAKSKHFYFEEEVIDSGTPGTPVTLSIDANLQFMIQKHLDTFLQEIDAKEGGAIVMDPYTGQITAMVAYPIFDPNNLSAIDLETTKCRPVTQAFELGSVIKVFSAFAALEEGVVTPDELIDCENKLETRVDGIRVRTAQGSENGIIPFSQVIEQSNNIGTVKVVKRVGKALYDYYKKVGFGDYTHIELPGEHKGFVNHPDNWSALSIYSLSYGYEITTTLVQLARAISVFANGGYLVQPSIMKKDTYPLLQNKIVSDLTLQQLNEILELSVRQGTGKRAHVHGYRVKGKTGTANVLENGQYNERKNLYTFIGWIEKDEYKKVIVTYVKEANRKSYAAQITAPLFKKIAESVLVNDRIIPMPQDYPLALDANVKEH